MPTPTPLSPADVFDRMSGTHARDLGLNRRHKQEHKRERAQPQTVALRYRNAALKCAFLGALWSSPAGPISIRHPMLDTDFWLASRHGWAVHTTSHQPRRITLAAAAPKIAGPRSQETKLSPSFPSPTSPRTGAALGRASFPDTLVVSNWQTGVPQGGSGPFWPLTYARAMLLHSLDGKAD